MQPLIDALIFIVDDDASVREALAWLLRSRRLVSEHFASAEAFELRLTEEPLADQPHCLLLDVRMPGMRTSSNRQQAGPGRKRSSSIASNSSALA